MILTDDRREMEAEGLARARETVQMVLRAWDWMTWNQLLADNVVLSLRLYDLATDPVGGAGGLAGALQVTGREEAKRVLKSIYSDLRIGLSVTTEIVRGHDVILLGNLAVRSTRENTEGTSLPIMLYMAFSDEGRVEKLTIAAVDPHPLDDTIRQAVEGALRATGAAYHACGRPRSFQRLPRNPRGRGRIGFHNSASCQCPLPSWAHSRSLPLPILPPSML